MTHGHVYARGARRKPGRRAFGVFLIVIVSMLAVVNYSWAYGDELTPNQALTVNQTLNLTSVYDGVVYKFVLQTDGNAVLYADGSRALWSTRTNTSPLKFVLQTDGNTVLYTNPSGHSWDSNTAGVPAHSFRLTDLGNLCVVTANLSTCSFQSKSGEQQYGTVWPDDNTTSVFYDTNVPVAIKAGWEAARTSTSMFGAFNILTYVSTSYYATTDYWVRYRYDADMGTAYAVTGCHALINTYTCEQFDTRVNSTSPHPNYTSLGCHEMGHTVTLPDYTDGSRNSWFENNEKNCMRGLPDVTNYAYRQIRHVNQHF